MTTKQKNIFQSHTDWRIWSKTAILFAMGIYLLVLILTGNLSNYINVRFAWLTYLAVLIFFLMGMVNLYVMMKSKPESDSVELEPKSGAYAITWGILAIMAIPLAFAVLIPSQALGASAVSGGISLRPVGVGSAVAFSANPIDRNILDWLREFNKSETYAEFNGLPVDISGFVYREPDFELDELMVSRFTMSCCVADAFAIGIPMILTDGLDLPDGTWIRVQGSLQASDFVDDFVPVIQAESVEVIDPPAQPYLYP